MTTTDPDPFDGDGPAAVALQPDGHIVLAGVGGYTTGVGMSVSHALVARYTAAGTLTSFTTAPLNSVQGLAVQPDNKIVLAGVTAPGWPWPANDPAELVLTRLNADGSVDGSFGQAGQVVLSGEGFGFQASQVVVQPDGKVVAAASALVGDQVGLLLARFNEDGSPDPTFGVGGLVHTYQPAGEFVTAALAVQPDGDIVAAGVVNSNPALVRYGPVHSTMVTGTDAGGRPRVRVFDPATGAVRLDFLAYDPSFRGGVRVAGADFTGDGVPDIVTAPGPGGLPDVRIFDGTTGKLVREFLAYDPRFQGGVYVAAADVTGDGVPDIITAPDQGGGPDVRVWNGRTGRLVREFMAYDPDFQGGVRVAAADLNADGRSDVITAPGPGGGPDVRVFDGRTSALTREFMAYAPAFAGGVYVAASDRPGGDGPEVVTGPGPGMAPEVHIYTGTSLGLAKVFNAYDTAFQGGVRVAFVGDVSGDGPDLVTTPGPNGGPQAIVFDPFAPAWLTSFYAYDPGFTDGVFVGGA